MTDDTLDADEEAARRKYPAPDLDPSALEAAKLAVAELTGDKRRAGSWGRHVECATTPSIGEP